MFDNRKSESEIALNKAINETKIIMAGLVMKGHSPDVLFTAMFFVGSEMLAS